MGEGLAKNMIKEENFPNFFRFKSDDNENCGEYTMGRNIVKFKKKLIR